MKLRVPPPACIPDTVVDVPSFKTWFTSLRVEASLLGKNYNPTPDYYTDHEFALKHWLHLCYDHHPAVAAAAEALGWQLDPIYYFLKLRRRFRLEKEGKKWKWIALPGYDNRRKPMKQREFQERIKDKPEPEKLERLIRQVFQQFQHFDKLFRLLPNADFTWATALQDIDNRNRLNRKKDYIRQGDVVLVIFSKNNAGETTTSLCHVFSPNTGAVIPTLGKAGYHNNPAFYLDNRPSEKLFVQTELLTKPKQIASRSVTESISQQWNKA